MLGYACALPVLAAFAQPGSESLHESNQESFMLVLRQFVIKNLFLSASLMNSLSLARSLARSLQSLSDCQ